jgi:hypothetical protein
MPAPRPAPPLLPPTILCPTTHPPPPPTRSYSGSGNKAFALSTALWTFQQRGVLEVSALRHRKAATGELNPVLYRVNDDVEFEIDIFEVVDGKRQPYKWVAVAARALFAAWSRPGGRQGAAPGQMGPAPATLAPERAHRGGGRPPASPSTPSVAL